MNNFENGPQSPQPQRPKKIAEAFVEEYLAAGMVTEGRCIELSRNPALREDEIELQKKNMGILLEGVEDVSSDEVAEKMVDFLILKGLDFDQNSKEN